MEGSNSWEWSVQISPHKVITRNEIELRDQNVHQDNMEYTKNYRTKLFKVN